MAEELLEQFAGPIIPAEPVIEFRGVSKTYPSGTHALEDVNIKINKGLYLKIFMIYYLCKEKMLNHFCKGSIFG